MVGQARKPRVGILALQGGYDKHASIVSQLGYPIKLVKRGDELQEIDKLILPGGESTAILNLLKKHGLWLPLKKFCENNPVFGTCAGAILLAKDTRQQLDDSLGSMDIQVTRNSYGRQTDSFETQLRVNFGHFEEEVDAVFIRAPVINAVGKRVTVLARFQNNPVLVEQGSLMACTFHPELTESAAIHKYFIEK